MTDGVVLLHGIFRTNRSMDKFERFLQEHYLTLNIGYPSRHLQLEHLVEAIHPQIQRFTEKIDGRIHFAGLSMGGLLARSYLHRYAPANLGRVLLIGTPNNGSEVADYFKDFYLYKKLFGPAGQQLVTNQAAFRHIVGDINYEAGAIAGNKTLDPVCSYIIGKPNDGRVSIESTKLPELKDHIIIPANHTFLASNRIMWSQALSFLQSGQFQHV